MWRYEPETRTIRSVPSNHWVASMNSWDGAENHQANARIIAAAPDLLAALQWALSQIEDSLDPDHRAALESAHACVRRATGGQ